MKNTTEERSIPSATCKVVDCNEPGFEYLVEAYGMSFMLRLCLVHWRSWKNRARDQLTLIEETDTHRVMAGAGTYAIIDKRQGEKGHEEEGY